MTTTPERQLQRMHDDEIAEERRQHAACLSIAEKCPIRTPTETEKGKAR